MVSLQVINGHSDAQSTHYRFYILPDRLGVHEISTPLPTYKLRSRVWRDNVSTHKASHKGDSSVLGVSYIFSVWQLYQVPKPACLNYLHVNMSLSICCVCRVRNNSRKLQTSTARRRKFHKILGTASNFHSQSEGLGFRTKVQHEWNSFTSKIGVNTIAYMLDIQLSPQQCDINNIYSIPKPDANNPIQDRTLTSRILNEFICQTSQFAIYRSHE